MREKLEIKAHELRGGEEGYIMRNFHNVYSLHNISKVMHGAYGGNKKCLNSGWKICREKA
jgi:hypothetical protein